MTNDIYFLSIGALLGAVAGSFLNAVALRTVEGRPWWGRERSLCPACGHRLAPLDLIPMVSWVILGGRCRYCGAPISPRYPLTEAAFSLWGAMALWRWGISTAGTGALLGGWLMMLNALTDWDSGYVYDHLAASIGIVGLCIRIFGGYPALMDGFLGFLAGGGCIATIIILSRGGMGWGDATLMAGAGTLLGWRMALLGTYAGFMIGGGIAVVLLATGRSKRKDALPLAPFLAGGVMVSLLWGPKILSLIYQSPDWPWR